jgi:hypothetical protein
MSEVLLQNPQYLEFERRLKSLDPEEQEQAILQFGNFIMKYPENVGYIFLRFIDLFVASPNDIRLLILSQIGSFRSTINESCAEILPQIVKKLTFLWESNDLLVKINVVTFYGYLADLIKDSSESLYRIVLSLYLFPESNLLKKAAIDASKELYQISPLFIKIFTPKAVELIENDHEAFKPEIYQLLSYSYKSPTTFDSALNLLLKESKHDANAKTALFETCLYVDYAARKAIENHLFSSEQNEILEKLLGDFDPI